MMTYEQACDFAKNAAKSGSILGLDSIRRLMEKLSDVQERLPIIHIAGTNGKGSVGAYLASIFHEAGLLVIRLRRSLHRLRSLRMTAKILRKQNMGG